MSGFDSLGYAQKLRSVGVPHMQAETEAELIRDQVRSLAATKGDLLASEERLESRILSSEHRLDGRIHRVEGGLASLDVKVDRVEERLKSELKQLEQRMTIKLGGATVVAIGVITALQKLLEG